MIGIEHIVFGYDHLLFVVSLVLLLTGFRTIAIAVTAFTVAHSITLIGTTLGFLGLPQRPVEAIIALSIVFLAVEIVKKKDGEPRLSERVPWVVAFLFGLLHGFGFAGALKEIGLPESDVPTALLTFNLGVEAGQLLIVAATLGLLWACGGSSPTGRGPPSAPQAMPSAPLPPCGCWKGYCYDRNAVVAPIADSPSITNSTSCHLPVARPADRRAYRDISPPVSSSISTP